MLQTLQKKFELMLKDELSQREDHMREQFEVEKQDFMKTIQDNMAILD